MGSEFGTFLSLLIPVLFSELQVSVSMARVLSQESTEAMENESLLDDGKQIWLNDEKGLKSNSS